jgi:hypothetical protein
MTDFDVCLSFATIKNIILGRIQEDFEFVVAGQRYKCPRIVAELLSPRVCLSHAVDQSIAEYFVEASDSSDQFDLFMSLGSGSTISVTKANVDFFLCLSREFGNSNVHISLLEHFASDVLGSQIPDWSTLDLFSEALIGRISSKFSGLTRSELDAIPVSVLFSILSHHLLKISTEDDLFSYIGSRLCSDPEYFDLLQFVRFEYLSTEYISDFLSALPHSIDRRLWESISQRLVRPVKEVEFLPIDWNSFKGIISYLTRKHGGNVHDNGIVKIASKSLGSGSVEDVADFSSDSYFMSRDEPDQWIRWDFHGMRVHPTHYTISAYRLKSWVVDGSLDGINWTKIDRRRDNEILKYGNWVTRSFTISKSAECRFIRLTQTDKRHDGYDYLGIQACEFFGTLLE